MATDQELVTMIAEQEKIAVYSYTPMCGTCQVAGKMLDVVEEIVKDYTFVRVNLNYSEKLAERYQVESVPCLLIFNKGLLVEKIYAFQSVPFIYESLQKY